MKPGSTVQRGHYRPRVYDKPAFDLSGDLTGVPANYLFKACQKTFDAELARRCAVELEKRGRSSWTTKVTIGGRCELCPKRGLYRVGARFFCSTRRMSAVYERKVATVKYILPKDRAWAEIYHNQEMGGRKVDRLSQLKRQNSRARKSGLRER